MIRIKEFITIDKETVTLVVTDTIAFWQYENKAYPCSPTDASWLFEYKGWTYTSMYSKYSDHISEMEMLWETTILPAIRKCDEKVSNQTYWEMAQWSYWGVNLLYKGVFITQYKKVHVCNTADFNRFKNHFENSNKWYLGGEDAKYKYDCYQNCNYFIEVL